MRKALGFFVFGASASLRSSALRFRARRFARPCGLTALVCGCAAPFHIARPIHSCAKNSHQKTRPICSCTKNSHQKTRPICSCAKNSHQKTRPICSCAKNSHQKTRPICSCAKNSHQKSRSICSCAKSSHQKTRMMYSWVFFSGTVQDFVYPNKIGAISLVLKSRI